MEFVDYVSGISFRSIQPNTPISKRNAEMRRFFERVGISLEMKNTILPSDEKQIKNSLRTICRIPKMSTFAIGAIINRGVSQMPDGQVFVNIGVWHGFTFLAGMINNNEKKCIGVENWSRKTLRGARSQFPVRFNKFRSPNHFFFEMDFIKYLMEVHNDPIGFYIYDALHTYENQLKALQLAEPFFSPGCIILIDDANGDVQRQATMDFISNSTNRYRILLDQTTDRPWHPTFWNGILVFQKVE